MPVSSKPVWVTPTSNKKRWTAFFLCLFLGPLGAHHFYVGRVMRGLLYCCTMGFFLIGWWFDLYKIFVGSFRDNVGVPLRR